MTVPEQSPVSRHLRSADRPAHDAPDRADPPRLHRPGRTDELIGELVAADVVAPLPGLHRPARLDRHAANRLAVDPEAGMEAARRAIERATRSLSGTPAGSR